MAHAPSRSRAPSVVRGKTKDFFEAADCLRNRDVLALRPREDFRDGKRLAEETLDFACAQHGEFVLRAKLVHPENGDDVLKIAIALEHFLHTASDGVMLVAHDLWRERFRS